MSCAHLLTCTPVGSQPSLPDTQKSDHITFLPTTLQYLPATNRINPSVLTGPVKSCTLTPAHLGLSDAKARDPFIKFAASAQTSEALEETQLGQQELPLLRARGTTEYLMHK